MTMNSNNKFRFSTILFQPGLEKLLVLALIESLRERVVPSVLFANFANEDKFAYS